MLSTPEGKSVSNPRKSTTEAVHRAMKRFPLILETLGELAKEPVPFPGDADIRHGCERALTAILVELSRIEPAPPGPASQNEEAALNWLHARAASQLIDADHLERFQHFLERILGTSSHHQ
jgi:hypothetical protein